MLGITALETQASKSTVQLQQTGDRRCASIAHRPDRGDRGCHRCRCPEPDAGARTPELCPYRLNNSLGWGNCIRAPPCPPLCNTVANAALQQNRLQAASAKHTVAPADALRRPAFLDVSSLNFGGAKSTAVFFRPVPAPGSVAILPGGRRDFWAAACRRHGDGALPRAPFLEVGDIGRGGLQRR